MYIHRCHSGKNQQWDITPTLQLKSLNKCIVAHDPKLGAKKCNSAAIQKFGSFPAGWALKVLAPPNAPALNGGEIRYKGKCLDWDFKRTVYWHKCHGGLNQKWHYNKKKQIQSVHNPSLCLDLAPKERNMIIWKCHSGSNQQWNFSESKQLKSLFSMHNSTAASQPPTDLCIVPGAPKLASKKCDPDDVKQQFEAFPLKISGN